VKTFRDMCKNFPIVERKLKKSFVNYKDKYKMFIKKMLQNVSYFSNLSPESLEELSYCVQEVYNDQKQVIFSGD
jgi:hypothetical protein